MTLHYVRTEEVYSVYEDRDGGEVYLAHGSLRRLVDFDTIDLVNSWNTYGHPYDNNGWVESIRESITEPDLADEIVWCEDCNQPMHRENDDTYCINEGTYVCERCYVSYGCCDNCDWMAQDLTGTLDNTDVCEDCRQNLSFCDDCDGYYRYNDDGEHDHDNSCGCESPAFNFTIRNDGDAPLANDKRVTVSLPAGVITPEGLNEIAQCIRSAAYDIDEADAQRSMFRLSDPDMLADTIGAVWQTRQGNFTKRLSRYAYNEHALKLDPDLVSKIGCMARAHSTSVDSHLEVTRDLNLSADEFGNEGSCWWNSYASSRCALKSNGGFGLRTFNEHGEVSGRVWVMPLKLTERGDLRPTFDTDTGIYVVFNGYGDLSGYTPARIMAHMAGVTYRRIGFTCDPMYINSGGYLVAPEEIAQPYTDGSVNLNVNEHSSLYDNERKDQTNAA